MLQDPEASADLNDRSDTENDPTPDADDESNRWETLIWFWTKYCEFILMKFHFYTQYYRSQHVSK